MSIVIKGKEYIVVPLGERRKAPKKSIAKAVFDINKGGWRSLLGGTRRQILERIKNAPEYQLGCYGREAGSNDKWELLANIMIRKTNVKRHMINGARRLYQKIAGPFQQRKL